MEGRARCFNGEFLSLLEASQDPSCCFEVGRLFEMEPGFEDAPSGDYHLSVSSALIDRCEGGALKDIDLEPRPVDDPSTPDDYGPVDIGADELQPDTLQIFSDGFESGDTTAWSSTVP